MIVQEVEGVDRIRVGGRWRHIRIQEDRGVGPGHPDGETVSVHGVAGDAAAGRRPREGDPCGGHAGGLEADGGGGWYGWGGGKLMEDGAHRVPFDGVREGGPPVLGARGAPGDVLSKDGPARCLCATRIRYALAASGRDRAGKGVGYQGREHELARTHRGGRTAVDDLSLITVRSGDLVERAREGDARIVGDGSVQERGRGDGYGNGDPAGRRPAVLAVVQGDVARVVIEHLRSRRRARPGAVHVVRYPNLPGGIVLAEPPDQQIPLGNRAGECDRSRRDLGSRERHSLDE